MESPLKLVKTASVNDDVENSETTCIVQAPDKSDILRQQANDCTIAEEENNTKRVTSRALGTVCTIDSTVTASGLEASTEWIKPEIVSDDDEGATDEHQTPRSRPRLKKTKASKRMPSVRKNKESKAPKSVKKSLNGPEKMVKVRQNPKRQAKQKKSLDSVKRSEKNPNSLASTDASVDGGNSRRQPFICGECSARFSDASSLVEHMEHHVAEVIASLQENNAAINSVVREEEPSLVPPEVAEPESEREEYSPPAFDDEEVDVPPAVNNVTVDKSDENSEGNSRQRLLPSQSPGEAGSQNLTASETNVEGKEDTEVKSEQKAVRRTCIKKKSLKRKNKAKEIVSDTEWESDDERKNYKKKKRKSTSRGKTVKSEIAETNRSADGEIVEMTPEKLAEIRKTKSRVSRLVKRERALLATPQSCDQCGKSFPYASDLKRHMLSHLKPNVCEECGERFSYASRLAVHRLKHSGERSISCPVCCRQFLCAATLARHMLKHDTTPKLCTICNRHFSAAAYERHLVRHANGTLKALACRSCGVEFADALKLKEHEKTHAADHPQEKPHQCTVCERRFSRRTLLRLHERVHTGERPFLCPECGSTFSSRSMFRVHVSTHALRAGRIDKIERGLLKVCNHCGRQFVGPSALRCHMRKHAVDRPYHCSRCDARFKYAVSMRRHEERHDGVRRFFCDACGKSFVDKIALCRHSYKHPDKRVDECGENHFSCDDCRVNFASEASLDEHMQQHDARAVLRCSFCDEQFGSKTKHALHEQKHVRPFCCEFCSKRFARKDHMQIHTRLHTGEKPFRCKSCGEAFGDPSRLYVHRRNLHGENVQSAACEVCSQTFANREMLNRHMEMHLKSPTNSVESADCVQAMQPVCYAMNN